MKLFWSLSILLILSVFGSAEQLKFVGSWKHRDHPIEFKVSLTATRPDARTNYTVGGTLQAKDGDYSISGTLYAKTAKMKGMVRRKNPLPGKPDFEQPIDGTLDASRNTLTLTCTLLSPITRVPLDVTMKAHKVSDSAEAEATLKVFKQGATQGSVPEMAVDTKNGFLRVRLRGRDGKDADHTIKFTPLPPAIAFGAKWTFSIDASSIPAEIYIPVKVSLSYIDNSSTTPYVEFDLSKGDRKLSKTITWNSPGIASYQGIGFMWSNSTGVFVSYSIVQMKRGDFDRLTRDLNQTAGAGGAVTSGSGTTSDLGSSGSSARGGVVTLRPVSTTGEVWVRTSSDKPETRLRNDMILGPGTIIDVDPESSATFQLPNGATVVLAAGTSLRVEQLSATGGQAAVQVRVLVGELLYRHRGTSSTATAGFVVRAGETTASTRGTEFTLKFDPKQSTLQINLRDGKLDFDPGGGLPKMQLEAPNTLTWRLSGG